MKSRKGNSQGHSPTSSSVSSKDTRLVYSTDPALNQKCPTCREVLSECTCTPEDEIKKNQIVAVLRIEKQGRSGKTVTVIDRLPKNKTFLKDLCVLLKKKCGSGGTFSAEGKDGIVEIQGDKRELVRKALEAQGIKVRG